MTCLEFFKRLVKYSLIGNPIWGWKVVRAMQKVTSPFYGTPELYALKKAFLWKKYRSVFDRYASKSMIGKPNDGPIWMCWWQGEEAMLPLVKGCYNRLLDMVPADREVILITKDNFQQYVNIPDFILRKLEQKKMSLTHFSDILRFYLLTTHGGLWVDGTTWVTRPLSPRIFEHSFYTCRTDDLSITDTKRVARGTDTPWLLAACKNSPILSVCRDIFTEYWKEYNYLYDYLFIDYCLIVTYDHVPSLHKEMDNGADLQNHLFDMEPLFNSPYDAEKFSHMSTTTPFFKLSYKMGSKEQTENGETTFFGHFCQYKRGDAQ